ncbi:LamB/YcsF family protein [Streptomyces indonesiensis]
MTALALNTDVGEGFGVWGPADEGELLDQVTAANVACGFHAGDPDILRRTCEAGTARGVAIGAQVSYRDLAGFGRRFIEVPLPRWSTNSCTRWARWRCSPGSRAVASAM